MTTQTSRLPLVVAGAIALPACLLFTDPVNSPPRIYEIVAPAMALARGEKVTFSAQLSDPDGDPVTLEWSSGPRCPEPLDASLRPGTVEIGATYTVTLSADKASELCVWLLARDAHGATDVRARTVHAGNRAPVAKLDVQQPSVRNEAGRYDLFSRFRLSAAASADPDRDRLTTTWALRVPTARSNAALVPCSPTPPEDLVQCFLADFPGDYQVDLTVDDGTEPSATVQVVLRVDEDSPPCITRTEPDFAASPLILDPAQPRQFQVLTVRDDGDPLPGAADPPRGAATFTWQLRHNGGDWRAIPGFESLAAVMIAADTFVIGDRVDLRVEVMDRVPLHSLVACGAMDICPVACPQRVTWNVEYR